MTCKAVLHHVIKWTSEKTVTGHGQDETFGIGRMSSLHSRCNYELANGDDFLCACKTLPVDNTNRASINYLKLGGAKCFVTFIEEDFRYMKAFYMKTKGEAVELLKCQVQRAERQTEGSVKRTVLDSGKST